MRNDCYTEQPRATYHPSRVSMPIERSTTTAKISSNTYIATTAGIELALSSDSRSCCVLGITARGVG